MNSESATLIALFVASATVAGAAAFATRKPAETGAVVLPQKVAVPGATLQEQCRSGGRRYAFAEIAQYHANADLPIPPRLPKPAPNPLY